MAERGQREEISSVSRDVVVCVLWLGMWGKQRTARADAGPPPTRRRLVMTEGGRGYCNPIAAGRAGACYRRRRYRHHLSEQNALG